MEAGWDIYIAEFCGIIYIFVVEEFSESAMDTCFLRQLLARYI
jgi:hypothetical protein